MSHVNETLRQDNVLPSTDHATVVIEGLVVRGDARGRTLGFPTANLLTAPEAVLPEDGVYAADWVWPDGATSRCAVSVGGRPTFYESGGQLVEAHVIGFSGDLYDTRAVLRFLTQLRQQQRFDSIDALVGQLHKDIAGALAVPQRVCFD